MSAVTRPIAALVAVVGLILAAFAFTTSASAYPAGTGASLSGSASVVRQGGAITVTGTHFKGLVTLTASGRTVGTVTAAADGTFSTAITLPADEFPTGSYTITAADAFGDVESITVSVTAASSSSSSTSHSSGGLATTGVALIGIGGIGVLLLLGGGIMLLAGRRPRATA